MSITPVETVTPPLLERKSGCIPAFRLNDPWVVVEYSTVCAQYAHGVGMGWEWGGKRGCWCWLLITTLLPLDDEGGGAEVDPGAFVEVECVLDAQAFGGQFQIRSVGAIRIGYQPGTFVCIQLKMCV